MAEQGSLDDTIETVSLADISKEWFGRAWEESQDPYLNQIFSEELYAARIPVRREIHLMVAEKEGEGKWWELPVSTRLYEGGSADIELNFIPSKDTYDAARTLIRGSLHEIEFNENPFNIKNSTQLLSISIPYLVEMGKMKCKEWYSHLQKST